VEARRARRHELCELIEAYAPNHDAQTGIPVGSEVEQLADAILASLTSPPTAGEPDTWFPMSAVLDDTAGERNALIERLSQASVETCGSESALGSYLIEQLPAILTALRNPPTNRESIRPEAFHRLKRAAEAMLLGVSVFNSRAIDRHVPIEGEVVRELADAVHAIRNIDHAESDRD
jgi:hypothetical protein